MLDVRWAHDSEVAPIERRELGLAEPLDRREHARVHEPELQIDVGLRELGGASELAAVGKVRHEPAGERRSRIGVGARTTPQRRSAHRRCAA